MRLVQIKSWRIHEYCHAIWIEYIMQECEFLFQPTWWTAFVSCTVQWAILVSRHTKMYVTSSVLCIVHFNFKTTNASLVLSLFLFCQNLKINSLSRAKKLDTLNFVIISMLFPIWETEYRLSITNLSISGDILSTTKVIFQVSAQWEFELSTYEVKEHCERFTQIFFTWLQKVDCKWPAVKQIDSFCRILKLNSFVRRLAFKKYIMLLYRRGVRQYSSIYEATVF